MVRLITRGAKGRHFGETRTSGAVSVTQVTHKERAMLEMVYLILVELSLFIDQIPA